MGESYLCARGHTKSAIYHPEKIVPLIHFESEENYLLDPTGERVALCDET
jgi:hypothetical protein